MLASVYHMTLQLILARKRYDFAILFDVTTYVTLLNKHFEHVEHVYPHSKAMYAVLSQLKRCRLHKTERHPTECDVINDVKLFQTSIYTVANFRSYRIKHRVTKASA